MQVDQQLKWSSQLTSLTSKISRGIGILQYSERYVPASTVRQMYKSLVEPHFRYCCPVWGNVSETSLTKLQNLQNRAARIVTGSRYDQSALPLIRALGWPTVMEILDLETLKMVFKSLNSDAPSYLSDMFNRMSETTSRALRNSNINLRTRPFVNSGILHPASASGIPASISSMLIIQIERINNPTKGVSNIRPMAG